jgi:hypothetical protein
VGAEVVLRAKKEKTLTAAFWERVERVVKGAFRRMGGGGGEIETAARVCLASCAAAARGVLPGAQFGSVCICYKPPKSSKLNVIFCKSDRSRLMEKPDLVPSVCLVAFAHTRRRHANVAAAAAAA